VNVVWVDGKVKVLSSNFSRFDLLASEALTRIAEHLPEMYLFAVERIFRVVVKKNFING
jgi:hypothetical protein